MNSRSILIIGAVFAIAAGVAFWQTRAKSSSHIVDVKVPALDAAAKTGESLYVENCMSCHGVNAGGSEQGPPLVHIYYEPNHHPDEAFYVAAKIGVRQHHWRFGNMPPVAGVTEQEVGKIIAYVRALQRANGIN